MTPTEREYTRRINRVVDHIETNLDRPLPLERLADVAHFSKYHFHRIFFAHVGETPGQFIQRLRIEKAARLLIANRGRSVTDVALDCGFSDSAAFARAFRAVFGVSPSGFRRSKTAPSGSMTDSNLSIVDRNRGKASGNEERYGEGIFDTNRRIDMPALNTQPIPAEAVTLVDQGEMTLAYVRHTGPYFGDEMLFQRLFGALYQWAGPRDLIQRGTTEEIIIYHDDPETVAPDKLRVSCCISVPPGTETTGEVGTMTLSAGRYAQARFRIDATQFAGAWNWVYGVWLPQSGYQPADGLCYERYQDHEPTEQLDGTTGRNFVVDICIPVQPL